jgi:hypothetical protein
MTVDMLRYLFERRHEVGGQQELQMSKNTSKANSNTNRRPGCQCGETCSCGAGCSCGTV